MPGLLKSLLKKRAFSPPSWSFVSFVVSAMLLLGCAGPPRRATWKTATGAGEFERLIWKAIEKKDWAQLEYRLAPSFAGVNSSGQVLDRNGWLEYWKGAQARDVEIHEIEVRPAGPDMVVTCVLQFSNNGSSQMPASQRYRVISVWQQLKGGWTLTATSLTPILSN